MNITQGFAMVNTKHPFAPGVVTRRHRQRRSLIVGAQIATIYLSSVVIVCGLAGIAWQYLSTVDLRPVAEFVLALVPNI